MHDMHDMYDMYDMHDMHDVHDMYGIHDMHEIKQLQLASCLDNIDMDRLEWNVHSVWCRIDTAEQLWLKP